MEVAQEDADKTTSADFFRREGAVTLLGAPSGCLNSSPYL